MNFEGTVEATLQYIIRDHDKKQFELRRKKRILEIRDDINAHFENYPVKVDISDQYFNMAEKILPLPHIIDIPKRVFAKLDIPANTEPIVVVQMVHNCHLWVTNSNIFTGCGNFHGPYGYTY